MQSILQAIVINHQQYLATIAYYNTIQFLQFFMYHKDIKTIYNNLKSSAKKRNITFDLNLIDLYELSYPITCPILNIPLTHNKGKPADNSFSIDRIDNDKGYIKDNLMVISYKANRIKNNSTTTELQALINYYVDI
jgi:hypothetical protein